MQGFGFWGLGFIPELEDGKQVGTPAWFDRQRMLLALALIGGGGRLHR